MRGYFEIGIYRTKTEANVGTLWRSAYQLGTAGIFTIGKRFPRQASDTLKTFRHVPMREHDTFDAFMAALPHSCQLIGVEMGGSDLRTFKHPERACYLLGAEDGGIPKEVLRRCVHVVSLPAVRTQSFNVAVAGSIVMYDRIAKEMAQ